MLKSKKNLSLLLACCIFSAVLPITAATFAAPPPEWLQAHISGDLKMSEVYYGAGFAEYRKDLDYQAMRLAKDRALDELCYQLSVAIQSKFEDRIVKKGDFEEQQIASSLFVSTRKVLSGVQEKDQWTDTQRRRHWVLLVIDSQKADQQVAQQTFVNEVIDRLEHKQDEVLEGMRRMTSLLNQSMQIYQERMNQFESLLQALDTKVEASGAQTKDAYASLRNEILRLESTRRDYENRMSAAEKRQGEQMEALMAQNNELKALIGRLSATVRNDYFLALANDDIQYQDAASDFRIAISPDKGQGADYYDGEAVRFRVRSSRGCYVKVIYLSAKDARSGAEKKMNTLLFPNVHARDNWLDAGETKVIGALGELVIQPPFGMDIVTVVASERQFADLEDILAKTRSGYYAEEAASTSDVIQIRTRGIAVAKQVSEPVGGQNQPTLSSPPIATDTCFIVSHAASQ